MKKVKAPTMEELAKIQGIKPTDIRTLSGTWPDDVNDGFEKTIDELRHEKEILPTKIVQGLRDLRYGIFEDQKAVNDLLDEMILAGNKKKGINLQISKQDDGYIVSADRFPGLSAWGETAEKAMLEFAKALKLYMEVMIEDEAKIG